MRLPASKTFYGNEVRSRTVRRLILEMSASLCDPVEIFQSIINVATSETCFDLFRAAKDQSWPSQFYLA
jgi:hypothetical protein